MPYHVKAFAMGIPAILIGLQIPGWIALTIAPKETHALADFRLYYAAGYQIKTYHAGQIYRHENLTIQDRLVAGDGNSCRYAHPAYEALQWAPVSLLPCNRAYFLGWG